MAVPLGGVLIVGGLALGGLAVWSLSRARTSPDPSQPSTALVTTGPYGWTRNPIYLGFTLIYLGFTLLARTSWGLILAPLLLIVVTRLIVRAEEAYLSRRFAVKYHTYRSSVRRWI